MQFQIKASLCCVVLLLTTTLCALPPGKPLQQYSHQTWQSESGLPQNTVNAVLQSRDGFIWLATEGGLVRFDGIDFLVFDTANTPALHSNSIHGLMEDSSGALWVSTAGGLLSLRAGKFIGYGTEKGLPSDSVLSAHAMAGGGVVAVTAGGIAALRGERFEAIAGTEKLSSAENLAEFAEGDGLWITGGQQVFEISLASGHLKNNFAVTDIGELQAIAHASSGELWVGGSRGLEKLRDGKGTRYSPGDGLPSENVTALLKEKSGQLWVGTSAGLALMSAGRIQQIGKREMAGASVQKLFADRQGTVWAGTNRGIARVTSGSEVSILEQPWLVGVLSMLEDFEGNMWFGTDTVGVSILRDQAFFTFTTQDGLSANFVRTIFQDHSSNVWLGTNGGGLDKIPAGAAIAARDRSRLTSEIVFSLAESGNDLWVGTPRGLDRIRGGQAQTFTASDGLADDFVRSLYADQDGSLWIGTRHGLSHFIKGKFTNYSTMDGLGSDLIGTILRARDGTLWVGTLGGLSRLNDDRFVNIVIASKTGRSDQGAVTSLLEDSDGTIWIGTNGAGLKRMRKGAITNVAPAAAGLPDTIYGLLEDGAGNLWISSRVGIYRAPVAQLNASADKNSSSVTFSRYGVANGLRTSEASSGGHPSAWRMKDGTLWFATLSGAAVVNPASLARNPVPPQTVIEQVLVDDSPAEFDSASQQIKIPPGHHQIAIRYAGLSFAAPQQVQYRYWMQGFDSGLVDAHGRRTAYYNNLAPGEYRFSVLSANNDGVWSSTAAHVDLKIEPYFIQTGWFYALLTLLGLALGYGLYRWRVVYVESKYKAVLAERGRIAREIHDTLAQGYVAVSVQLELATRLMKTSTEAAAEPLERSKELVREGLAEARSTIWNLRSQAEAETLPALLAAMVERGTQAEASGPVLKLEVKGTYRPLPREVEAELLRIAQEAVANARRHAAATHIWIQLSYDGEVLRLTVRDDGHGFNDAENFAAQGHYGLQGMRERANAIGARMKIMSKPSSEASGTSVNVEVDLKRPYGKNI